MIGILDVEGKNNNPLTNKPYSNVYKNLAKVWSNLPAYEDPKKYIDDIKKHNVITIVSGTGSGKTVLFPKYVLHVFDYKGKIAITFPKKDIAKSSASYAASALDVILGQEVGYQYRNCGSNTYNNDTKMMYMTDGTLVARLLTDPLLSDYNGVLVDEAHERKVNIDFLLYLLKNVLKERKDFKVIIMSATINEEIFKNYFKDFKYKNIFIGSKTNYPIKSIFVDQELDVNKNEYLSKGIEIIQELVSDKKDKGNIVLFVPSINETKDTCELLARENKEFRDTNNCVPMFSGMNDGVFNYVTKDEYYEGYELKNRKVIIATNMFESSITVKNISYVIDCGLQLLSRFDPKHRINILEKTYITHAQAKQRMGRTGRTGAGTCYHLYTQDTFERKMEKFPAPSIVSDDISFEMMRLLGIETIDNVGELKKILKQFIEPPKESNVEYEIKYLRKLKMIDSSKDTGKLTQLGFMCNELQIEPSFGLSIIMGFRLNCFREITAIISVIEIIKGSLQQLFTIPPDDNKNKGIMDKFEKAKKYFQNDYGDHIAILKIFKEYEKLKDNEKELKEWCYKYFLKRHLLENAYHEYQRKKNMYRSKLVQFKLPEVDETIMNHKMNYKILASLYFGLSSNVVKIKGKNIRSDIGIQIDKYSFLNFTEKEQKIMYFRLFRFNKTSIKAQIISKIPKKSIKIIKAIGDAI
uniref:Helicase ATP-binding domain-containing protein n=1 Tax=viral metagenome TaxID=1070528 RepID=A0A6C0DZ75_9ZZZZ